MKQEIREMLVAGASEMGVLLEKNQIKQFSRYLNELKAWNEKINLTTITEDRHIVTRHFLDSLTPLKYLKGGQRLLDLGSGAGFPGIPLKIVKPDLRVTLIDAREKKVLFQRHVIRTLGLAEGICAVHGRAEALAFKEEYRQRFDVVISRALSSLKNIIALSHPFLKKGGMFIAIKGKKDMEEAGRLSHLQVTLLKKELVRFKVGSRETALLLYEKKLRCLFGE